MQTECKLRGGKGSYLIDLPLGSAREAFKVFVKVTTLGCYKDLVFARGELLSVVGAQNESLRIINVFYVYILIWDHNNFARVTSEPKYPI